VEASSSSSRSSEVALSEKFTRVNKLRVDVLAGANIKTGEEVAIKLVTPIFVMA
jgi:hypothetical protein